MAVDYYNAGMNAFEAQNFDEAIKFFKKGLSDARCNFSLGIMYYNGQGVEKSFKTSIHYYSIAAEAGIVPAQVSAGFAYANAMGVPEDFDKAAYFLKMASDKGEASAKITLAEIYAMGHAGGDRKEAAKLIRDVLSYSNSEEAMDVYNKYQLNMV